MKENKNTFSEKKRKEPRLGNEKNPVSDMKRTPPQNRKEQRLERMNQMIKKGTGKNKSNRMKIKATKRYGEEWLKQYQ